MNLRTILALKETVSRNFLLQIFLWIIFPQATKNTTRIILNFFENLRRYSQVKVHHWYQRHQQQICHRYHWHRQQICHSYQWHRRPILPPVLLVLLVLVANRIPAANLPRWQTMGTISDCWQLEVNLKEKLYLYANSTTQGRPKEITKTFLIATCVNDTGGAPWAANISVNFQKNLKRP